MKKNVYLFLTIFLVTGLSSINAQQKVKHAPQVKAKTTTHEIHKAVNLSGEQQREIFSILVDAEQNIAGLNSIENPDAIAVAKRKTEIQTYVDQNLKRILNKEQYAIYLETKARKKKE